MSRQMRADARRPARAASRPGRPGGFAGAGAAVLTLCLLVLGVVILAPSISGALAQQRHIADLRAQVAAERRDLGRLTADEARWSDPAYIRAQAGSRLFYVMPGETTYRVTGLPAATTKAAPSTHPQPTRTEWTSLLLGSLIMAGTTTAPAASLPTATPSR